MSPPTRWIGLDIHKDYFLAAGVNAAKEIVLKPRKVPNSQLDTWIEKTLTKDDAVILEMTTNAYAFYDALLPHVHSVTVMHPPHLKVVVETHVKTDRRAAIAMAQQHAAGPLVGIWIPPQEMTCGPWWHSGPKWCGCPPPPRTGCTRCCIAIT